MSQLRNKLIFLAFHFSIILSRWFYFLSSFQAAQVFLLGFHWKPFEFLSFFISEDRYRISCNLLPNFSIIFLVSSLVLSILSLSKHISFGYSIVNHSPKVTIKWSFCYYNNITEWWVGICAIADSVGGRHTPWNYHDNHAIVNVKLWWVYSEF